MKRFLDLIQTLGLQNATTIGDAEVSSMVADSRGCSRGSLYVCMPSRATDTHGFLASAREAGAVACVVHTAEGFDKAVALGLATVFVESKFNETVAELARVFFEDPSSRMRVVGVTGTNGKTTTAWMMRDALRALGRRPAYMGTLGFDPDGHRRELANTTPFPVEVWQLLDEASVKGAQDFVMEASSHALIERRLSGVRFEVGVFTNLSQDHLDFHGDMESYAAAKLLLFTEYAALAGAEFRSAINVGDETGREFARKVQPTLSYGSDSADLVCRAVETSVSSIVIEARYGGGVVQSRLGVGGNFNAWNATSALAGLLAMGYSLKDAAGAMESVTPVPGRFESVQTGRGFSVIVDYAHTDDALQKLLASVSDLNPRRIITVFGCGGDRDKTKRPKMARAASTFSDVTIVTSDNPRTEDPEQIIRDVVAGLVPGRECETIIGRPDAVRRALQIARDGDVVVIAGKGHEDYQIIGRTKHHMDDRELVKEALGCP